MTDLPLAEELAGVYGRMSGVLLSEETVTSALHIAATLALETLPSTVGAGITLVDGAGKKTSAAATSALVERADALQYELDEGPCLTAWAERRVIRIDEMASDERFPRWSRAVAPLGLHAMISAPLVAGDVALGAMKVYARAAEPYDARHEHLLTLFAAQAAVMLANVQSYETSQRLSSSLRAALRTRDIIGQAKGILMAREGVDEDTAFAMMSATSQEQNVKVYDLAVALVQSTAKRRA